MSDDSRVESLTYHKHTKSMGFFLRKTNLGHVNSARLLHSHNQSTCTIIMLSTQSE